ncbi:MAG: pyrroline-5-carboxylate reductase [Pseudomonadota bacterium]
MASLAGMLLLIGAGKMGGAMLDGWLKQGTPPEQIAISDPLVSEEMRSLAEQYGFAVNPDLASLNTVEVVLLAVKPQMMDDVLPQLEALNQSKPLYISVAAGRTIAGFEAAFGSDATIIRAMPNTPAAVGRGITALCPNANCTEGHVELASNLLSAIGEVVAIDDEKLMDAVTGVSGSGPAYVFHLIECMAAAGEAEGLPADIAMKLARATVAGAGELVHQSPLPASTLRENVTSPAGTTAAALDVLMADDAMPRILREGIAAATRRSEELAG